MRHKIPEAVEAELKIPQGQKERAGWKTFEERVKERAADALKEGTAHWQKNGKIAVQMGANDCRPGKSWVDFTGTIKVEAGIHSKYSRLGVAFHFDTKKVALASMELKEDHFRGKQKRQLMKHARVGAVCFLLIHFNHRKLRTKEDQAATWAVPVHPDHEFWVKHERGLVSSLSRENAEKYGVSVEWTKLKGQKTFRPDIVTAVKKLIELPIPKYKEGPAPW